MPKTIIISGASSGFGAMTARRLADAGHTVYAGMRGTAHHNRQAVADAANYADDHEVDLRTIDMDVSHQASVNAAVATALGDAGRLDVVVHNAGHMVLGPTEAFTVEQIAAYDTTCSPPSGSTAPSCRTSGPSGTGYSCGSAPPAREAARRPTSRRTSRPRRPRTPSRCLRRRARAVRDRDHHHRPGSFTTGTNHFANAGHAEDTAVAGAYEAHYAGLMEQVSAKLAELAPDDADPAEVARQIARIVDLPKGERPFRVHIDPADDGAAEVNELGDRIRERFYHRIGLDDLLHPAVGAA